MGLQSRHVSLAALSAASPSSSGGVHGLVVDEVAANTGALSPRLTVRMTQTAAIRATLLARQQQLQQQHQSLNPLSPTSAAAAMANHQSAYHSRSSSSSSDSDTADEEPLQQRRGGALLNQRRHARVPSTQIQTARFLSPVVAAAGSGDVATAAARDLSPSRRRTGAAGASLDAVPNAATAASTTSSVTSRNISRTSMRGRRGKNLALIVDANTLTQRLTSVALYRAGFTRCDVATSGESGVQMARSARYDLIVVQLQPSVGMSLLGVDAVRAMRFFEDQEGAVPATIVALAGSSGSGSGTDGAVGSPAHLASLESARFSAAIELGAVLAEAIPAALQALQHNGNFLFIDSKGRKTQSQVQQPLPCLPPLAQETSA
jgi:CheY-like chemotaxis protein